jgi:hypothetical protein
MGTRLIQFKVSTFPKMRVIGKGVTLIEGGMTLEDSTIEDLWASMVQDGSFEILAALPGRLGPQGDQVGWMGDFHPPDMHFTYLAGELFKPDIEPPEGFICREIEAGEMAVSQILGTDEPEGGILHVDASRINNEAMAAHASCMLMPRALTTRPWLPTATSTMARAACMKWNTNPTSAITPPWLAASSPPSIFIPPVRRNP